jgi:hypothetical protein
MPRARAMGCPDAEGGATKDASLIEALRARAAVAHEHGVALQNAAAALEAMPRCWDPDQDDEDDDDEGDD